MDEGATGAKVPRAASFVDLSDYARPVALWIARRLRDTNVTAPDVTAVWGVIGIVAAFCYAVGGYKYALLGAGLIQVKNILDAVDGSLARLQVRPSRIGRFLDSIGDAVIGAALYVALAIAVARERPIPYAAALAAAALVLSLLQGSVYNYYQVRYRQRRGGDRTSLVKERLTEYDRIHYEDRPLALGLLRQLIGAYNWIYGWQDVLVQRIDRWTAAPLMSVGREETAEALRDDRRLLTVLSALGPGMQILILDLYTIAGYRHLGLALELFLWTVALGGTLYAAAVIFRLRRAAVRESRSVNEE
ncbi:MAG: CDP-alcohol phosphatidyltransferase family protein [Gemmatimonadota bacterium]|nr:MAG: CDP-alcohol phosphatidyltransferase family protein [Gemmatimonadota bacterium]